MAKQYRKTNGLFLPDSTLVTPGRVRERHAVNSRKWFSRRRCCCKKCGCSANSISRCTLDCTPANNNYAVDLGVGGWTNDTCINCESIAGVFIVTLVGGSDCNHVYTYDGWDEPCGIAIMFFSEQETATTWHWCVQVQYGTDTCWALWTSATLNNTTDPCTSTVPTTLNRVYNFPGTCCNGTLPATVTVSAA